jgi:hypothetical protein
MYSLFLPGCLVVGVCTYIVIVILNMSLDGCKAPESLFISLLWHASLSDERDGRLDRYPRHETKVISKKIKMLDLLEVNMNACTVWLITGHIFELGWHLDWR